MQLLVLAALAATSAAFSVNSIHLRTVGAGGAGSGPDCSLPRHEGDPCPGPEEEAWYYLPEHDRCTFFVYTGCGGNSNRFMTREGCESACVRKPSCPNVDCPVRCTRTRGPDNCPVCACTKREAKKVCRDPVTRGYCRAMFHRWGWSTEKSTCTEFVYGGCGGNDNNFETKEMCQSVCGRLATGTL